MILFQQFIQAAQKNPGHPALRYLGKETGFGELRRKIAQLSYLHLAELGNKARVAFLASNCPAVPLTFFAMTNIRAVTIPLDPSASYEELAEWIGLTQATHLAVTSDLLPKARELVQSQRLDVPIVEIEKKNGGEYDESYSAPPDNPPKDTDIVLILRTAGTTGEPKLVQFDHKALQAAGTALRMLHGMSAADRIYTPLNWSHPFAWMHGMLFPLLSGLTTIIGHGAESEPSEFVKFLIDSRATRMMSDPETARRLLHYCKVAGQTLPSIKGVVIGLAGVTAELTELAEDAGTKAIPCYGQTEDAWAVSVGDRILTGLKCKVMDGAGDAIESKEDARTGALAVTGPPLMKGYYLLKKEDADKATKMAIRGTWLYTGDVAELQATDDGELMRFRGRKEELLESETGFASCTTMDAAIRAVPGVHDAAGFVAKDMKNRHFLAVAVVRSEGVLLKEDDLLRAAARSQTPREELPRYVFFVEFLPRSRLGIVNRVSLSRQFQGVSVDWNRPLPAEEPAPAPVSLPAAGADAPSVTLAPPEATAGAPVAGELPPDDAPTTAGYETCALSDLLVDEPLPATLYVFYKGRMIPFRSKGGRVDRFTYDRLEVKRVAHLFVKSSDVPALREWRRSQTPAPIASRKPADPALANARENVHEELMKFFVAGTKTERLAAVLVASKALVDEVMKSPYAARPIEQLLQYAKGTVDHSVNVGVLATYLGLQLGYSHNLILQDICAGALLHDVGALKLAIEEGDAPAEVEMKKRLHPQIGSKMLEVAPAAPENVRAIVGQCMEAWDGTGFPKGLKGAQIYDPARVVAIAHAFEEAASSGSGSMRERYAGAIRLLATERASKFDPEKLEKALKVLALSLG